VGCGQTNTTNPFDKTLPYISAANIDKPLVVVMNFSHSRPHHDTILLQQWIKSKMNESFD
jgi:hypothetical protein